MSNFATDLVSQGATMSHDDEQARLEAALAESGSLLLDSLRRDERRRRRRRLLFVTLFVGGILMAVTLMAVLAGWLTLATTAPGDPASTGPRAAVKHDAVELAEGFAQQGWQLWQQQKYSDAAELFEKAVELDPEAANAWNGLGWARFNCGQANEAIQAFEKCVELEPKHPAGLNGLGQAYLSLREYGKAEKYLVKAAPKASASWYGLSRVYLLTGKYADAQKYIKKALAEQPGDADLKAMLDAAKAKSLPDELRRKIEPPAPVAESSSTEFSAEGWQQFNQGKMRLAERSFRRALVKNPEDGAALNGLGFCLLNMGKSEEAKGYFEKCLELNPEAAGAMNGLARCQKDEGQIDEAIATWEKMREKFPGPNAATVGLATTYLERGEKEKALPLFEELVTSAPDNAEFKQGLEAARGGK
jgi:tetratricopeptide (TPR) repeat protein